MESTALLLLELFRWIEQTGLGNAVRMTPNLYPVLMSVHVIGIALLVGPAVAVDLRLLGIGRDIVPVTVATRLLLPISHVGFAVVAATGVPMFTAVAVTAGSSAAAPWKFGLILLAAFNIAVFHKGVYRSVGNWDLRASTPPAAKVAAFVSASAWMGVIFAGRFLAY